MVRRRASQVSRSAVSGLIGPAPSSMRRCVVAEVHDQGGGAAPHAVAGVAGLPGEGDERVGGGLLPVEDRAVLLVGGALRSWRCSRMACSNAAPCSSGSCPLKASSRPPFVQVMRNARRW